MAVVSASWALKSTAATFRVNSCKESQFPEPMNKFYTSITPIRPVGRHSWASCRRHVAERGSAQKCCIGAIAAGWIERAARTIPDRQELDAQRLAVARLRARKVANGRDWPGRRRHGRELGAAGQQRHRPVDSNANFPAAERQLRDVQEAARAKARRIGDQQPAVFDG